MEKYSKYLVIKRSDIDKYLKAGDRTMLKYLADRINRCREWDGKKKHNYIVVNQSKSYAEQVWNLIEQDEALQNKDIKHE